MTPTTKKTSKAGSPKKAQVKVADMKPSKDAKGGRGRSASSKGRIAHNQN